MKIKLFNDNTYKDYDFSTPLFLIFSTILILIVIGCRDYVNNEPQVISTPPAISVHTQESYKVGNVEIEADKYDSILNEVSDEFIEHSCSQFIRSYCSSDTIYYEVYYNDIEDLYEKRNNVVEIDINNLCTRVYNIWRLNGYNKNVSILVLSINDPERVLFSSYNGQVDFSIHENLKKEATREDWINLFIYYYEYTPNEEELDKFIKYQQEYVKQHFYIGEPDEY